MKPLYDRVLIKHIKQDFVTESGLILMDNGEDRTTMAEVIEIGTGRILPDGTIHKLYVKLGLKVIVDRFIGQIINIDSIT